MEKNGKTRENEFFFLLCVSSLLREWSYLKRNMINLTHMKTESEQACSYGLTMDRGLHHGQSMMSYVSKVFCSFLLLRT